MHTDIVANKGKASDLCVIRKAATSMFAHRQHVPLAHEEQLRKGWVKTEQHGSAMQGTHVMFVLQIKPSYNSLVQSNQA